MKDNRTDNEKIISGLSAIYTLLYEMKLDVSTLNQNFITAIDVLDKIQGNTFQLMHGVFAIKHILEEEFRNGKHRRD